MTPPTKAIPGGEAGVEMTWKVFAGEQSDAIAAAVYLRAANDGFETTHEGISQCLRAHLHRGLGYIASESPTPGITGFFDRWLKDYRRAGNPNAVKT